MWRNRPRQTGAEKGQAEVSEGGKIGGSRVCEGQKDWLPPELAYRFSFYSITRREAVWCPMFDLDTPKLPLEVLIKFPFPARYS